MNNENVLSIPEGGTGVKTLDELKQLVKPDETEWIEATLSTNLQTGGKVYYKQIGDEVRVRISGFNATALSAQNYAEAKLIATGLPIPKEIQFGVGKIGTSFAMFFVSDDEFSSGGGRLCIFGFEGTISSGYAIRSTFSYLID